jgi:GTP1/OBG
MFCPCRRLAVIGSSLARLKSSSISASTPKALRLKKGKSTSLRPPRALVDFKLVKAIAGKGGDGLVSFAQLWANDKAGPDGGDGGHGADILFQVNYRYYMN